MEADETEERVTRVGFASVSRVVAARREVELLFQLKMVEERWLLGA